MVGMLITRAQFGQRPFLPAVPGGVRTRWLQCGQENSMGRDWLPDEAGTPCAGRFGALLGCLGIGTITPQLGHLPFLPAVAIGVRTGNPHSGQVNSILSDAVIGGTFGAAAADATRPRMSLTVDALGWPTPGDELVEPTRR